jgi:hypothetical protein
MKERVPKNSRNSNEQATPYLTKKRSNPRSDRYQLHSTGHRDEQPRGGGGRRTGGSRIRPPQGGVGGGTWPAALRNRRVWTSGSFWGPDDMVAAVALCST